MSVPLMFGRFLIMRDKVTENELTEALKVQSELNRSFAEELLEGGHIDLEQFRQAWTYQREKFVTFKDAVRALELVGPDVIEQIDSECSGRYIKLGELLVQKGSLSAEELEEALKEFQEGNYMSDL
ncbi:MAG: hypothetical protein JSV21_03445 [Nitrospirota bacterium]|nr:MAG: hypothetical protein JSV21_03445 [Nitrospirota bacterium]